MPLFVHAISNEPPRYPRPFHVHILGSAPEGEWEGQDAGTLARRDGETWIFETPMDGQEAYVNGMLYTYHNGEWAPASSILIGGGGTPSGSVTEQTEYGLVSSPGESSEFSRGDHSHGTPPLPTKADIGLGSVDNTSDADKPISSAVQAALDGKSSTTHDHDADYEPKNTNIQAHIASTSNPHAVTAAQVGLGNVANLKVNLAASVPPEATDDETQGYAIGSRWIDTVAAEEYVCVDATEDAAVWENTTASGGSSAWGAITGTLSDQTDLQNALDGKSSTTHDHDADYEPKNTNIQAHIASTSNPHAVTLAQAGLLSASLANDFSTSSTSLVDVTGLGVSIAANQTYWYCAEGAWVSTHSTNGMSMGVNGPGTPAICSGIVQWATANPGATSQQGFHGYDTPVVTTNGPTVVTAWRMSGAIRTDAAGTFVVRVLSEQGAHTITLKAGSSLTLTPVG